MNTKNYLITSLACLFISLPIVTQASESEEVLIASCQALGKQANSTAGQLCELYQQGYVAGALATDSANADELAAAETAQSEFVKRAMRTRVGSRDTKNTAYVFLHFCLPAEQHMDSVISRLRKYITPQINSMTALDNVLYDALKAEYPCK